MDSAVYLVPHYTVSKNEVSTYAIFNLWTRNLGNSQKLGRLEQKNLQFTVSKILFKQEVGHIIKNIQRVAELRGFCNLEETALHEICVSGTVVIYSTTQIHTQICKEAKNGINHWQSEICVKRIRVKVHIF